MGVVGKFRTIDAAVAVLVCLSCRYWADGMGHGAAQLVHVTRSVVLPVNSNPLACACLYELGPCIGLRAVTVPYCPWLGCTLQQLYAILGHTKMAVTAV